MLDTHPAWRCSTVSDVHLRRLEDRIRELCAKAVTSHDSELDATVLKLRRALREHAERLRKLAATKLAGTETETEEERQPPERRSA